MPGVRPSGQEGAISYSMKTNRTAATQTERGVAMVGSHDYMECI